ncbi:MAG: hypothetical protein WCT49_05725 [Candidatus Paceibacterota bacterium]|nr:hypothetical protein [Candidatus Paceibacterota bacterium]
MKKYIQSIIIALFIALFSASAYATTTTCGREVHVPFFPSIYEGETITNQYNSVGIIFDGSSVIKGGNFLNPSYFFFMNNATACKVTVVLKDWNDVNQTHTLVARDRYGRIINTDTIVEKGFDPMPTFPLVFTVKQYNPRISSLEIVSVPSGFSQLISITYSY